MRYRFKDFSPYFLSIFAFLFAGVLLLINSEQQLFAGSLFTNDFNAWLLPAIAPLKNMGMPYLNYWAIEPPALLLMTTFWAFFGSSLAWFHILNILLQVGTCFLYWKILRRSFPWYGTLILYCTGLLLYFSPTVQSMFFPSEINGTFFVFLGLYFLLKKKNILLQAFLASFAFSFAGQMKEVFAFSVFALVPLYMLASLISWKTLLKTIGARDRKSVV